MTDSKIIKAYGDALDDGAVQVSFTLPLAAGPQAKAAAASLAEAMGLDQAEVVHMASQGAGFSFFVVYGHCHHQVDLSTLQVTELELEEMDLFEINDYIRDNIGRKLNVVAACTGTDAHTVGIDAIMNMKGYNGEYGLERYPWINAYNLGSQVDNTFLVAEARRLQADAILVSQVVTQRDVHIPNLTRLVELLEAEGIRNSVVLVAGGPRISHQLALELGYDAGFGAGTTPRQVASYIAREIVARKLGSL
ncbi:MAG: OAM dimerization domain-containing protein [Eubacteriales bacterium]|nr:OAM dimerization domain-containing protein [Eubacteriales bacterium]